MTLPRVSVVIPVYNGERYLPEALASLEQIDDVDAEFIVVDDGSADGSIAIATAVADRDPRFRIVHAAHGGVALARNKGLSIATGAYITFLDCDDLCPPNRIARQSLELASRSEVDVVVGETLWFEALTADLEPEPGSYYLRGHFVTLHSALFRRSVFEKFGDFDQSVAPCEDLDFFLRLSEGDANFLMEKGLASLYRRHVGNMTNDKRLLQRGVLGALQKSMARRRASGITKPMDGFFMRRFQIETALPAKEGDRSSPASNKGPSK